jgi:molybdopterin-guanine dinucleotide biosynthesis protein A
LILAGGQGLRMEGRDKGLQDWRGEPLVCHVLRRLRGQVGPLIISANRNLSAYSALGAPVWPDLEAGYPGPLAGLLTGLNHATTPWVAAVACDAPLLPLDLVDRLAQAARTESADIAMATVKEGAAWRPQPVFCLVRRELRTDLERALKAGQRKALTWMAEHRCARVRFDDPHAFFNANTLADLQGGGPPGA